VAVIAVPMDASFGDEEIVSPELVLVSSPAEARRARERLPDPPDTVALRAAAGPPPEQPPPPVPLERAAPESPSSAPAPPLEPPPGFPRLLEPVPVARPRRRAVRPVFVALLVAAVAVGGWIAVERVRLDRAAATGTIARPPVTGASARVAKAVPTTPASSTPAITTPAATTPAVTTPAFTTPAVTTPAVTVPQKPPPVVAGGFVPARNWAWAARPGAHSYSVTFLLAGRVVLHASTKVPHILLPPGLRFRAGHYRVLVRAEPARAGEQPLVDSTFDLTAASAAAANAG
jgi:hypothetical protein